MDEDAWVPPRFRLPPAVDEFMLAVDAARWLSKTPAALFHLFPALYRRQATTAEKAQLAAQALSFGPLVTLVLAREIDGITSRDIGTLMTQRQVPEAELVACKDLLGPYRLARAAHAPDMPLQSAAAAAAAAAASGGPASGSAPPRHAGGGSANPANPAAAVAVAIATAANAASGGRPRNPLAPAYARKYGLASVADELAERLVPIRLHLDLDGVRLRETFTWNLNDTTVTVRGMAAQLCADVEVSPAFVPLVVEAMELQIAEFAAYVDAALPGRFVQIQLDLPLGPSVLTDRFLWAHDEALMTPEQFCSMLVADLGLGGDVVALAAFSIREQLFADRKIAVSEAQQQQQQQQLAGGFASSSAAAAAADKHAFRVLSDVWRSGSTRADTWGPQLKTVSLADLDKQDVASDRESRRQRRATRPVVGTSGFVAARNKARRGGAVLASATQSRRDLEKHERELHHRLLAVHDVSYVPTVEATVTKYLARSV